ncbi:MAG: prepilin-type N-terminal cleavage/methylation domain-containing protein [Smithellaceae bacterium]
MNIEYHKTSKKQDGFTVIEIIAVILVIAIVGVIAVSRMTSPKYYNVAAEVEILKANLRFAQYRALSDADTNYGVNNVTWGISLSGNSYTLQHNGVIATTYFPGENSATHNLPSGISITQGAGTIITYNIWGSPSAVPVTTNIAITLTDGSSPKTITVTQNTGFIP